MQRIALKGAHVCAHVTAQTAERAAGYNGLARCKKAKQQSLSDTLVRWLRRFSVKLEGSLSNQTRFSHNDVQGGVIGKKKKKSENIE